MGWASSTPTHRLVRYLSLKFVHNEVNWFVNHSLLIWFLYDCWLLRPVSFGNREHCSIRGGATVCYQWRLKSLSRYVNKRALYIDTSKNQKSSYDYVPRHTYSVDGDLLARVVANAKAARKENILGDVWWDLMSDKWWRMLTKNDEIRRGATIRHFTSTKLEQWFAMHCCVRLSIHFENKKVSKAPTFIASKSWFIENNHCM